MISRQKATPSTSKKKNQNSKPQHGNRSLSLIPSHLVASLDFGTRTDPVVYVFSRREKKNKKTRQEFQIRPTWSNVNIKPLTGRMKSASNGVCFDSLKKDWKKE